MSIRLKLSFLIAAAGLVTALIFSASVLFEMLEQPIRVIDAELKTVAYESVVTLDQAGAASLKDSRRYWIKIYKAGVYEPLYVSHIARHINLPEDNKRKALVYAYVPDEVSYVEHDSKGLTAFRIRRIVIEREHSTDTYEEDGDDGDEDYKDDEASYVVYAAISAERIKDEIVDLIVIVTLGLLLSVIVLTVISYIIAGYILQPVRVMNLRIRNITEKNLSLRIPLKENCADSDEFNTLAITLNGVFDRLENAFNRQKRLIADASHELKTPLSIMRLITDDVTIAGNITPEDASRLSNQVLRMEKLVRDILNLSGLELDRAVVSERVDLKSILEPLTEDYTLLASGRNIQLTMEFKGSLVIMGDYDKLFRAFSNILDNAVKYSDEGGKIKISAEHRDGRVEVRVFNTGEGIPAASLGKVFEQFYRVEQSRASRYGGSGLGLAIVKRIIELHGGTVGIESRAGESVTFSVNLPAE